MSRVDFAGVGVTDQRNSRKPAAHASPPLRPPVLGQHLQFRLELAHPPQHPPPVDLQLRFARAPRTDLAGLLRQRLPPAPKARQPVAELGQLDLRLAFLAPGVLGEDVEDDGSPVDRGAAEQLFQVAGLGRRQLVVEDDRVGVDGVGDVPQLARLALPHVGGRIGRLPLLDDACRLVGTGRVDEQAKLVKVGARLVHRGGRDHHPDKHDLLAEGPLDKAQRSSTSTTQVAMR